MVFFVEVQLSLGCFVSYGLLWSLGGFILFGCASFDTGNLVRLFDARGGFPLAVRIFCTRVKALCFFSNEFPQIEYPIGEQVWRVCFDGIKSSVDRSPDKFVSLFAGLDQCAHCL